MAEKSRLAGEKTKLADEKSQLADERELARQKAVEQENAAERNFQMAAEVVDRYLDTVSEDARLRMQGLEPLRIELLELAREFYERLVQQQGDNPSLEKKRAMAYFMLAMIDQEGESKELEIASWKKVADLFEQLSRRYPEDHDIRYRLALVLNNMGSDQETNGQSEFVHA